ncbi:MAG: [FeFe] hydrogenase H-cluster radical SAM maturase HydE [Bacteroidales bacterium]|nr:[FeFe] hydrogenase H-cluster radical SAM maturase HydE [Bacteroidales bacterium]
MKALVDKLIKNEILPVNEIVLLLQSKDFDQQYLFKKANEIKLKYVGNKVYFRGLIEYSNICRKNCYYCGIRRGNKKVQRYTMSNEEVINAALFAYNKQYGSIVIQAGENNSDFFVNNITYLIGEIRRKTNSKLAITLSLGEQSELIYEQWYKAGASRYLLRIEVSDKKLYKKLHPNNQTHDFENRLLSLYALKKIGYQVGTGVMIGLPFQTLEHLANDLIFMKEFDIDMCGMGPYIEHSNTPLFKKVNEIPSPQLRFNLSLKMIALLRIMMKDINIAATTALQALDKMGREKAIAVGANIIMPNITPVKYRDKYFLYENKPCYTEEPENCSLCIERKIRNVGCEIAYGELGDSKHYLSKFKN